MSSKITIDELEKYLWGSAVLLRTHVDAGAYKQYIFPLLFFKRLSDVYDEECEKVRAEFGEEALDWEENHQFQIPDGAHWNDVRNVSQDVGKAIIEAFHKIETANPEKLHGIFGEASWTNKNRLPDRLLKDMLEHFSTKTLSIANCPADELGQGYEYLIKQFADDSGHTAQEFYTNRTVVNLMTEMLKPQPGESIYDPTCGSAGMLISAVAYLKQQGLEWRNLSIYGQEIVTLTSAIARMNLLLHGVQDFNIVNADTLKTPAFTDHSKLQQFDLILANPPWMSSGEVHMGRVTSTEKKISQLGYDKCSTKMVPLHTVVIALAGQGKTRGTVAVTEIELCTNQSLCAMVTDETVLSDYLYHNLRNRYEEIRNMCAIADGRGGLNLKIVGSIKVIVPSIEEQQQFVAFAEQSDKSKFALQEAINDLDALTKKIIAENLIPAGKE